MLPRPVRVRASDDQMCDTAGRIACRPHLQFNPDARLGCCPDLNLGVDRVSVSRASDSVAHALLRAWRMAPALVIPNFAAGSTGAAGIIADCRTTYFQQGAVQIGHADEGEQIVDGGIYVGTKRHKVFLSGLPDRRIGGDTCSANLT